MASNLVIGGKGGIHCELMVLIHSVLHSYLRNPPQLRSTATFHP